jgi:acyl dehydratase
LNTDDERLSCEEEYAMKREKIGFDVVRPLTRERIEEQRRRIGMKFAKRTRWAHWEDITDILNAIGDPNPLWNDAEYARGTRYGRPIAPPYFLVRVWAGAPIHGLPGVQVMVGGASWEYYKPVLEDDMVTAECTFVDLEEKSSAFSQLWLIEHYDVTFHNQRGELVALQRAQMLRWERGEMDKGLQQTDKARRTPMPHPWTKEELRQIEDDVLAEVDNIRGSTPRYWEDVNVGEILPELVRGPRRISDIVSEGLLVNIMKSGTLGVMQLRRHPGYTFYHPDTRANEHIEVIHWDKLTALHLGFAYPYDWGSVRQCWTMEAVNNWIGDDAWLKRNAAQARRPVYLSDVLRVKGVVTSKYVDEHDDCCVDIELSTMNQRGDNVMPAQATTVLPSRERGTWPVANRLPTKE